jgi:DNA-binding NarL/FixJ family response regulator
MRGRIGFGLLLVAIGLGLTAIAVWRVPPPVTWTVLADELVEKLTLVLAMAAVAWVMQGMADLRQGQVALSNNLARAVSQGAEWRSARTAELAALGSAIADQFRQWQLSAAETDIAGLMLKGASLKEIALARDTSEATIRQQAQSIYRKSGLSGRTELSAYFLESLFETSDAHRSQRAPLTVVSRDA